MNDKDDEVFETQWSEWDIRKLIQIPDDTLRPICHLWFSRGIRRGVEWASETVHRHMECKHVWDNDNPECSKCHVSYFAVNPISTETI